MWDLNYSINIANFIKGIQTWGKAAMESKDLIFDDCCEGKIVEEISKELPDISVAVFAHAFIVKAIHLRDLPALVIASQNRKSVFVAHF
jgi:hypothetical protein